uniref:Uncharacterized protein n=1 Tax=Chrysemys picta bellii TaxID=8478 RepID=A0A8C3HPZ8_CHRPI
MSKNDWQNTVLIEQHENSTTHRDSMLTYLNRRQGFGLTQKLEEQIKGEREYWQHVLQRVIAVIQTLAECGLPFRGSNGTFGSLQNGNFLGLLELVAQFDPFLAGPISKYGNAGKGNPLYLSKTICDELIGLMSDKVRLAIVDEISTAGYFSLSVDSTPDLSHIEQLSIVLRYVSPTDGKPAFRKNKYAIFIPCAAHSLNLVGCSAVDCCPVAVRFFSTVQLLYTFFSASTHRWAVLKTYLGNDHVLKSLSNTRWEAHAVATSAILESYSKIVDALESIAEDQSQRGETIREAENIANKMQELEFVFMLTMWNEILQHFCHTSQALQEKELDLKTCADLCQSLADHLHTLRNDFERFEDISKDILPDTNYKEAQSRKRIRKKQANDSSATETALNPRDKFRVSTYYTIIDTLEAHMKRRGEVYKEISSRFPFLNDMNLPDEQYSQGSQKLVDSYPFDLNMNLCGEVRQFHCYMRAKFNETGKMKFRHIDLHDTILKDGIQCEFPNVELALRIFLTLMITNCSAERSFSQLKRIKNPQRTTMCQDRLDSLSLLCMEADMLHRVSFDELIQNFAIRKSRKKLF